MNPYKEETYSDGIAYMRDNTTNRNILTENGFIGEEFHLGNTTYIEVNLIMKIWRGTPDFQWLYRNPPPLKTIDEIYESIINIK